MTWLAWSEIFNPTHWPYPYRMSIFCSVCIFSRWTFFHWLPQVVVDVHIRHTESQNEALCLEILSVMRRCLTQQADIRLLLYEASTSCPQDLFTAFWYRQEVQHLFTGWNAKVISNKLVRISEHEFSVDGQSCSRCKRYSAMLSVFDLCMDYCFIVS